MRRALKVLGVLLALFLLYTIAVGLGLTSVFKGKKSKVKVEVLNDFERPGEDLFWSTGGYITLETASENQTHGRRSMKATFLLPAQFIPTPTPTLAWAPSMRLGFDTVTPLTKNNWSKFTSLNLDVFNNEEKMLNYTLKVDDGKGYTFSWAGQLLPKRVTNISVNLDDLKTARMDLTVIRAISFSVEVTGAAKPVVVYLDYLRLEGPADGAKPAPKAPPVPVTMNRAPIPTATVPAVVVPTPAKPAKPAPKK
jgi:hypothetical protein